MMHNHPINWADQFGSDTKNDCHIPRIVTSALMAIAFSQDLMNTHQIRVGAILAPVWVYPC